MQPRSMPTQWLCAALLMFVASMLGGWTHSDPSNPVLLEPAQTALPVIIADDDFAPDVWRATAQVEGEGTFIVTLANSNGNPDQFRYLAHSLPPIDAGEVFTIYTDHLYEVSEYIPYLHGAISFIDFRTDGILLSFPDPEVTTTIYPLLEQHGRLFRATKSITYKARASAHAWESKSLEDLTASDFVAIDGSNLYPLFGARDRPIRFGFSVMSSRSGAAPLSPANQTLTIEQGIDNWQVTVHRNVLNEPPLARNDVFVTDAAAGLAGGTVEDRFFVLANDRDQNGDTLEIISVTKPSYGEAKIVEGVILFTGARGQPMDTFQYTVSDGLATDTADVTVYFDCACVIDCLNTHAQHAMSPAQSGLDLELIYQVRDQILKGTPTGRHYIDFYYDYNAEILLAILGNEQLRNEALAVMALWEDELRNLVYGDGTAILTEEHFLAVGDFFEKLNSGDALSVDLKKAMADARGRLGPYQHYYGMTVREARNRAIGEVTYHLPQLKAR